MLLAPFASSFWAYSATLSSISRSFLRLLSSISVVRGVSTEAVACSSGLFGESSLTGGLTKIMITEFFSFFEYHQRINILQWICNLTTKWEPRNEESSHLRSLICVFFFIRMAQAEVEAVFSQILLQHLKNLRFSHPTENGTSTFERSESYHVSSKSSH